MSVMTYRWGAYEIEEEGGAGGQTSQISRITLPYVT